MVETWATGAEIARAFQRANGRIPAVDPIDEVGFAEKMDKGISDSMAAGIWKKWNDNHWEYDGEMINGTKGVEEMAREMV